VKLPQALNFSENAAHGKIRNLDCQIVDVGENVDQDIKHGYAVVPVKKSEFSQTRNSNAFNFGCVLVVQKHTRFDVELRQVVEVAQDEVELVELDGTACQSKFLDAFRLIHQKLIEIAVALRHREKPQTLQFSTESLHKVFSENCIDQLC
jgi:hypothetical protein